jgi:hypothetical protein
MIVISMLPAQVPNIMIARDFHNLPFALKTSTTDKHFVDTVKKFC